MKKLAVFCLFAFASALVTAQTSNGFVAGSDAVAIYYNGQWSVGTDASESYDLIDFGANKTSHFSLEGREIMAPTPGFNIYAGGFKYEPDLSNLFNKTNVQPGSFGLFIRGAVGNGIPSVGQSHIAFTAGGGVKYQITQSLTWQSLQANYFRVGNNGGIAISTGLQFIFGPKTTSAQAKLQSVKQ